MAAKRLVSTTMRNLSITENLTVGEGAVAYSSYSLSFLMNETKGTRSRNRYSALFDTDKKKTWMVPKGIIVTGITLQPQGDEVQVNQTIANLKALPTSFGVDEDGITTPCGEIAFVVHRTTEDEADGACNPTGSYMIGSAGGGPDPAEAGWVPDGTSEYNPLYANTFEYFRNFIVNAEGGSDASGFISATLPDWDQTTYRQAIPAKRYTSQPGAPIVYIDASRTLFNQLPANANDPACRVHIDMSQNGLVGDGTWGIALGLVAESGYPSDTVGSATGAKDWPYVSLAVTVHTMQVRS